MSDDVVRLSLPYPGGYVNVFLVLAGEGVCMIDAGHRHPRARAEFLRHLDQLGIAIADVRRVLVTHAHADHVGLLPELAERAGPEILIHRSEVDGRRGEDRVDGGWLIAHGLPPALLTPVSSPSQLPAGIRRLDGDEVVELGPLRLELIVTPGHSPGMLCCHERSRRWMFSSDQLLRSATPLWLLAPRADDVVGDYLAGLEALRARDVARVLPGHGRAFGDLAAHAARAAAAHTDVVERLSALLGRRPCRAFDLAVAADVMPPDAPARWRPTEVAHALGRTLAYLCHLRHRGAATFDTGTCTWSAVP